MNLAFSVDSILVAVAMSPNKWVVLSGGLLGVLAMRVVASRLVVLMQRYPALVDGAFVDHPLGRAHGCSSTTRTTPAGSTGTSVRDRPC